MGVWNSIRSIFGGATKTPLTEPSGSDGVATPGGFLFSGEVSQDLTGQQLWLTYSNTLANVVAVAMCWRYFLNLIAGTEWTCEAPEGTGADGERACDIVRKGLFEANMPKPWSAVVRKSALYKAYGFSMHEWSIRKRPDGLIAFAELGHRPQSTIYWWDKPDEKGPLLGVQQLTHLGGTYYVPRDRLFYCVDDSLTDLPSGIGMLRHTVGPAKRLQRLEQLEMFGFETDLRGVPVGRAPLAKLQAQAASSKNPQLVTNALSALADFTANHVRTPDLSLILDSSTYVNAQNGDISSVPQWAIDMLKGDGAPLGNVAAAIERVNREIARPLGAEFLLMGGSAHGSLAMHEDKTTMFASMIATTLAEMADYAQNDLARKIVALNGLDPDVYTPNLLPGAVSTEQVAAVTKSLLDLAQAGAPLRPDDPAVDQLRARMHLAAQPKLTPDLAGVLPRATGPIGTPPDAAKDEVDVDTSDLDADSTTGLGGGLAA